jgi:hypothetical protein
VKSPGFSWGLDRGTDGSAYIESAQKARECAGGLGQSNARVGQGNTGEGETEKEKKKRRGLRCAAGAGKSPGRGPRVWRCARQGGGDGGGGGGSAALHS